ncbi:chorismate synthase [Desulfobacula sp.]|uniref:chorismate synthase n=1 Tax=Desulfobacula sp. TaxID=2593537 RepID=UPI0026056C68|nr:chorismate synthase [Desulfobacula sp.]
MSGSSFGKAFNITTFGESHGKGTGVVIQGCPPGLAIDENIIQNALDKRKPGHGVSSTKRKEPDHPIILSGIFNGQTTGTPIMIMIENKDAKSKSYKQIASLFRPGHGDYTYQAKYGIRDYRGGGRASARETAARVAAGAVAQLVLDQYNITIKTYTLELGGIKAIHVDNLSEKNNNALQCPDLEAARKMEKRIKNVKNEGDSLGGVVEIMASNVPAGLGEPVFDKLDADIAKALMSIGAVKAVEIGAGTDASQMTGFENNDQILPEGFQTNHSGGILAGISNGDDIIARAHVKPIPSILKLQQTIDENGNATQISTEGRHDICAIPRINKVCEAMMAIVLTDHLLRQKSLGLH